jgi:hypothetical protein
MALTTIDGSNPTGDRDLDCEAAMLDQFHTLVEQALRAGWLEDEIANALLSLTQKYALTLSDDALILARGTRVLQ